MNPSNAHPNHLINEKSPYLLQHAYNPVDWYPWSEEAFNKARTEDRPVFLSIGYSTCHWCHVMAHESFEDKETADYLNKYFVSIKVDKEERPDIDSIYMAVCQAFTGSGGWPTSIFLTPDQKPFFAGTYYPLKARYGMKSFMDILKVIHDNWVGNRSQILISGDRIVAALNQQEASDKTEVDSEKLFTDAEKWFRYSFDELNGGFGQAPKFPTPHNLWFLLDRYRITGDKVLLHMVEKTLIQLYRGGIFDHIGYGFSRYSTDDIFLAPHFEKMLYDNALLILAYSHAYSVTGKQFYLNVAERTATYILREMTDPDGGFYCAQDADAEGEEGKFYLFTPRELEELLGEQEGKAFCKYYDITERGNFEGKSIPNLLKNTGFSKEYVDNKDKIFDYRKPRYKLHLDDKILASWNGLMIGALCVLYRISNREEYLAAAESAMDFLLNNMCNEETLYVSYRNGRNATEGFLDDYAYVIFALLNLYDATLDCKYADRAKVFYQKAVLDFFDERSGGFFLYGAKHENLIMRPKESYDGAMPSGNSVMTYDLVRLCMYVDDNDLIHQIKERQISYMTKEAASGAANHTMFLIALLQETDPPEKIVVVPAPGQYEELKKSLPLRTNLNNMIKLLKEETSNYHLINNQTTYYICKGHSCLPPQNSIS